MKESVTIFFFANNNHLSNVRTLQSIYRQNCDHINLIVCNDCTYGFQSERLLNNFEAGRPANVEYVHFHENPYPMGEFASQRQFWDRIDSEYYLVIHSGEQLAAPDALRACVDTLRLDKSLAAAVMDLEEWDAGFKHRLAVTQCIETAGNSGILSGEDRQRLHPEQIRDCMVVYYLPVLRRLALVFNEDACQISGEVIPYLLEKGHRIVRKSGALCRYSEDSVQDVQVPEPTRLGSEALHNIQMILQDSEWKEQQSEILFHSSAAASKTPKRNYHLLAYKLCTFTRIKNLALITLLLYIAAALFLLTGAPFVGPIFMMAAGVATVCVGSMLVLNLYYKRNPQRLVAN